MPRATATPVAPRSPRPARVRLHEDVYQGGNAGLRVDEDAGVIYGVKVLGLHSENGRDYTPGAVQNAVARGLFEGAAVRRNHPRKADEPRDADDALGWLRNVRVDDSGGLVADLHYLKSHPFNARIVESARRNPAVFGLSINGQGETAPQGNGREAVQAITEIRSVDIVLDPATTRGLHEQRQGVAAMRISVRKLFEGLLPKVTPAKQAKLKRLLEDDGMDPMMSAEADAPVDGGGADPDEAMWTGFSAAIMAILDQYKAGELDAAAAAKAVAKYLKAHDKLTSEPAAPDMGDATDTEDVTEGEGEPDGDEGKDKDMKEQVQKLRSENAQLREEKKVRDLCEGFTPTAAQLKALVAVTGADRTELIESFKTALPKMRDPKSGRGTPPPPAPKTTPPPTDPAELAKWMDQP